VAKAYVLKKIPLWPVIRVCFVVFIIIGILIGILYALLLSSWSFLISSLGDSGLGDEVGILRGIGLILIPLIAILYAVFGTIVVAIWVLIYNLIASVVGGIELMLEPAAELVKAAPPQSPGAGEGPHVPPEKTITGF